MFALQLFQEELLQFILIEVKKNIFIRPKSTFSEDNFEVCNLVFPCLESGTWEAAEKVFVMWSDH